MGHYFKIGYYGDNLQYNIKSFKPKDLTSLCSQIKKVYVRSHAEFNCTSMSSVRKEVTILIYQDEHLFKHSTDWMLTFEDKLRIHPPFCF